MEPAGKTAEAVVQVVVIVLSSPVSQGASVVLVVDCGSISFDPR